MAPSGDRFAVRDDHGWRDMSLWPTTSALLEAGRRYSTRDLSADERYSRLVQ
jgi:hypothetical protein